MNSYIIFGIVMAIKSCFLGLGTWVITICYMKFTKKNLFLKTRLYFIKEFLLGTYVVFILYSTGLIGSSWSFDTHFSYNFIPFIKQDIEVLLLNCVLFIPYGALTALEFKKINCWWKSFVAGLSFSLTVEVIQICFVGRLFDVDDLIMNVIGTLIGYNVFMCLKKPIGKLFSKNIGKGAFSLLYGSVALVVGIPYHGLSIGDITLYTFGVDIWEMSGYRISELITILGGIGGIIVGVKHKKDFLTKIGITISMIAVTVALMNIKF